jgi:hypothetical protein
VIGRCDLLGVSQVAHVSMTIGFSATTRETVSFFVFEVVAAAIAAEKSILSCNDAGMFPKKLGRYRAESGRSCVSREN